ncbi:androglobin isoform X2 [Pelobates cultripes]|uniref:Androglobin isoform X2 n=1 Tax=Pelobates cultripes TaxID=61616 RepID=A0AAD1RFT3_PELCU|nr:androglobin isoform X2 [Pelobates cultripes]
MQRALEWAKEGISKPWKAIETHHSDRPLSALLWLDPTITATQTIWHSQARKLRVSSFQSPLLPLVRAKRGLRDPGCGTEADSMGAYWGAITPVRVRPPAIPKTAHVLTMATWWALGNRRKPAGDTNLPNVEMASSVIPDHSAPDLTGNEGKNIHQDGHLTGVNTQSAHISEKPPEDLKPIKKETWIDYSDFCKCFHTLYVFHKPNTYPYTAQKSDFKATDDRGSYFLFVDNLKPTEIVVSFSALVSWGDTPFGIKEETKLHKGLLTVEQYTWKNLLTGPVVLKIHTYATKATIINLPPGRHVLRFTASSPLGHHIHLCSTVPFVFGDEETVMPYLDKESYRFMEQAKTIIKAIGKVMTSFNCDNELPRAFQDLARCVQIKEASHIKIFNTAFWNLMTEAVGKKVSPDLIFAYRALTLDFNASLTADLPPSPEAIFEVPASWQDRISTDIEGAAANKLQACWKGCYIRKCFRARKPGTKENTYVKTIFDKVWAVLEPNAEQHGVKLLRYMYMHSPYSHKYAGFGDEPYRISFADYLVTYLEHPSNAWFVVFREVFHVPENMLIVPKMYTTLPICALHIINNDTLDKIPWVFNKVVPHIYAKNKKGYTFVAEVHTGENAITSGKFRLRLIGACNPLPILSHEAVNNSFSMREIKDYYIPNNKNVIFRYSVKTSIEHVATMQVQTSKPDVFIKIQILDNEDEVVSATGKGQAIIPAFCFIPTERPSSCRSVKSSPKKGRVGSGGSQKMKSTAQSETDVQPVGVNENTEERAPVSHPAHKYIIQAIVLNNSWTLTESQAAFVQTLKELEKQEARVYEEVHSEVHHSGDVQKPVSTPKTIRKGKTEKPEKEKSGKDRERLMSTPTSRPESQAQLQTDLNKPSWILRLVSQTSEVDTLEVKKDTERLDEIRAMKQAWELAEPGRAVKALQSRLQYINKYVQKINADTAEMKIPQDTQVLNGDGIDPAKILGSQSMDPDTKEFTTLDLTPFLRKTRPQPLLRDEYVIQQQALQKAEEIQQYRQRREEVIQQREQEQIARNLLKKKVLQTYEDLQISLDNARQQILSARESYRNKLLEVEKKKQDAVAAQETSHHIEQKKSPSPKRKSAKSTGKAK